MNIDMSLNRGPKLGLFATYLYEDIGEPGVKPNSLKTLVLKLICGESK